MTDNAKDRDEAAAREAAGYEGSLPDIIMNLVKENDILLKRLTKAVAENERLQGRENELLQANNRYLERARTAERIVKKIEIEKPADIMSGTDIFMWAVAEHLQYPALTHDPVFQEFCQNSFGHLTVEQAAEEWNSRR